MIVKRGFLGSGGSRWIGSAVELLVRFGWYCCKRRSWIGREMLRVLKLSVVGHGGC
jgi:hypothetical protein